LTRRSAGGRYGQIGIGDLLIDGELSYFGSRVGWSANTVVEYKVITGHGSIIIAEERSNTNLFWALKGENKIFGIVTRYDMKTLPVTEAYTGGMLWAAAAIAEVFDALNNFVAPGGGIKDPDAIINPAIFITPRRNIRGFEPIFP
jgi:hypothetical protein